EWSGIIDNAAVGSSLECSGFPSPTSAGVPGQYTVAAKDPYGNIAPSYAGTVHFTSTDSHAARPDDYTFTRADAGMHPFSAILKAAGSKGFTATDTATSSITGTQTRTRVVPAAASSLMATGFPSPTVAGVAHRFAVTALDPYGNRAVGYFGTVHFSSSD